MYVFIDVRVEEDQIIIVCMSIYFEQMANKMFIADRYLAKPLLINDSKFDMRVYVYVTSYDPLRAYVFEDGLARFASCK